MNREIEKMKKLLITTALSSVAVFTTSSVVFADPQGDPAGDAMTIEAVYMSEALPAPEPESPKCLFSGLDLATGVGATDSGAVELEWHVAGEGDYDTHLSGHTESYEANAPGFFAPKVTTSDSNADDNSNMIEIDFSYVSIHDLYLQPNGKITIVDLNGAETEHENIEWQISLADGNNGNIDRGTAEGGWPAQGGGWLYSDLRSNILPRLGIWQSQGATTGTDSNTEIARIDFGDEGTPATEHAAKIGISDLKIFPLNMGPNDSFAVQDGYTYKMSLDVVCYSDQQ